MSSGVALSSIVIMHGIGLNRTILHKYIEAIILKILDYLCVALKNSPFAPLGSGAKPQQNIIKTKGSDTLISEPFVYVFLVILPFWVLF